MVFPECWGSLMKDELTSAVAKVWAPRLKEMSFKRAGRRDFVRLVDGIVQVVNFQVSAWGSRRFCVSVTAHTVCGNEDRVGQPGFRLKGNKGADLWLPSEQSDQAESSVETAWKAAVEQAIPWFNTTSSLEGLIGVIRAEDWGSKHHQQFQIAIIEALLQRYEDAQVHAQSAIELYRADTRDWASAYCARAEELLTALRDGRPDELLTEWYEANKKIHRVA